jgi:hypothetical protein
VTTTQITTYTCNLCGRQEYQVGNEVGCSSPSRWAGVEWCEPPEEGKVYLQWKRMDLCPDHLNLFLKWVTSEQEASHQRSRP